MIPGFADTAVGPHNLHVSIARELAQSGFAVLRFDYRGQGESDGRFEAFTHLTGFDDANVALELLMSHPHVDKHHVGVIGYSLGGLLAWMLAAAHPTAVSATVLVAPVATPHEVFTAFFSSDHLEQMENQGWADWLGWRVGKDFLKLFETFTLPTVHSCQTLVIHGTNDTEVPSINADIYETFGAQLYWLHQADHQFSSVKIQQDVIQQTVTWFISTFNVGNIDDFDA